jgi:AAA15 family ATPase/GTPase
MLKSLKIENFRCFPSFEMGQLGRLNLIVGTNNSGKTSILEAVQLLTSQSHFEILEILKSVMIRRDECINNENGENELDIRHLFSDRTIHAGNKFSIGEIHNDLEKIAVSLSYIGENHLVSVRSLKNNHMLTGGMESHLPDLRGFEINIEKLSVNLKLSLSPNDGLSFNSISGFRKDLRNMPTRTQVIGLGSLTMEQTIELFDKIVLTQEEDFVTETIQLLEPNIKRIAVTGFEHTKQNISRRSFMAKLANKDRIPIGSMGDGVWRIFGLALAIVNAKDGVLLVDEIDTGLHFTVMSDMWKMLWETAKRLNVQIFATTHSNDCWQSLADIANAENPSEDGITIHRIEKGKPQSIVFTEDEIAIAAEEGIEVR